MPLKNIKIMFVQKNHEKARASKAKAATASQANRDHVPRKRMHEGSANNNKGAPKKGSSAKYCRMRKAAGRSLRLCLSRKTTRKPEPTRPRLPQPLRLTGITCLGSACMREAPITIKEPLRKAVLPNIAVCARQQAGHSIPGIPLHVTGLRRMACQKQVQLSPSIPQRGTGKRQVAERPV